MDPVPTTPDAPSASTTEAPETVSSSDYLAGLTDVQRQAWERDGTLTEATIADAPADAASAREPDATKPKGHKGNAETRIQELLADRAKERDRAERLERELTEARQRPTPPTETKLAAPSPAPVVPEADPEPKLEDFEADPAKYPDPYLAFVRANARWEARQEFTKQQAATRQRSEAQAHVTALETRNTTFRTQIEAAGGATFIEALSPEVKALRPFDQLAPGETPNGSHAVAEEILSSTLAPQIMRHFTDHPEDLTRIAALPPRQLLREMGKLEARLEAPEKPSAPVLKTVSTAPVPTTTLGSHAAEPADVIAGAIDRQDFATYSAEMNRRELAARR